MQAEQEKRNALDAAETANARLNLKAGEADNLRRRGEAERREVEKRRTELDREYKQQTERLKAERDELARQLELTKTSNEFDKHEARQDGQLRRPRNMPSRPKAPVAGPAATPKKTQKNIPLGDGFDDEDMVMASPSRRREKSKVATPRQASKRKRMATNDSPIAPLQLSEPRGPLKAPEPTSAAQDRPDLSLLRNLCKDDRRFSLVHRLLSHRSSDSGDRVLEALVQYTFPSQPQKKLSSLVYDALASLHVAANVHELALGMCRVFLDLWRRCLREKYYAPLRLLMDALQFTLACEPCQTAVHLIEDMVPTIAESITLVAAPMHEAAKNMDARKRDALFSPAQRRIAADIQSDDCMELLYVLATSSLSSPDGDAVHRFWRAVPVTVVLLLLKPSQPVAHVTMMLRILATSALAGSIGPIHPDEATEQPRYEFPLIVNLTELLSVQVAPVADPQDRIPKVTTEEQTWQLRLRVLGVLTRFSVSEHGAHLLAHHKNCIGRLVNYLNSCLSALYAHPLSPTQSLAIASINATMRLLHHLYMSTNVQIKSKLNDTLGGPHAFHVSMTRLAFSEGLVLEQGIDGEVMDMAHDILNDGMGPEEGDELMQVFPSANSA